MGKNEFLRGKPVDVSGEQLLSFIFKAVTLLICFTGIWAATQRFAASVGYDAGWVGEPSRAIRFHGREYVFYPFWKILYWTLVYFRRVEIHRLLFGAMKIAGYTSVAAIGFYFLLEFVLIRNRKQNIFGTARWATKKRSGKSRGAAAERRRDHRPALRRET